MDYLRKFIACIIAVSFLAPAVSAGGINSTMEIPDMRCSAGLWEVISKAELNEKEPDKALTKEPGSNLVKEQTKNPVVNQGTKPRSIPVEKNNKSGNRHNTTGLGIGITGNRKEENENEDEDRSTEQ